VCQLQLLPVTEEMHEEVLERNHVRREFSEEVMPIDDRGRYHYDYDDKCGFEQGGRRAESEYGESGSGSDDWDLSDEGREGSYVDSDEYADEHSDRDDDEEKDDEEEFDEDEDDEDEDDEDEDEDMFEEEEEEYRRSRQGPANPSSSSRTQPHPQRQSRHHHNPHHRYQDSDYHRQQHRLSTSRPHSSSHRHRHRPYRSPYSSTWHIAHAHTPTAPRHRRAKTHTLLASASSTGLIIVFSLTLNQPVYKIPAHDSSVTTMQMDEEWLVSGGNDGKVSTA
jgi:hypothetical protein